MSKAAVLATAITVITPAWTGSLTIRSAAPGAEPAMFRLTTSTPFCRTSCTARVISPPISAPARTSATAEVDRMDVAAVADDDAGHLVQDASAIDAAAHDGQRRRPRRVYRHEFSPQGSSLSVPEGTSLSVPEGTPHREEVPYTRLRLD